MSDAGAQVCDVRLSVLKDRVRDYSSLCLIRDSTYPILLLGKLLIRGEQLGLVLGSVELEHGDAVDELGHFVDLGIMILMIMILELLISRLGFSLLWC